MTRLRWFRENMLAIPRLCLPSALPAPPGPALSRRFLSLYCRQLVRPGISHGPVPKLRPRDDTWAGQGAAHSPSTPAPRPRQRPCPPGQSRAPSRPGPTAGAPYTSRALRGRVIPSCLGSQRLTWARGGPREAPPPCRPHSASQTPGARKIPRPRDRREAHSLALGWRPVSLLSSF